MADSLLLWALSEPQCFPSFWAVVLIGDQLSYYCEFIQHVMCCKMPHIQFISHFISKSLTREGGEFRRIQAKLAGLSQWVNLVRAKLVRGTKCMFLTRIGAGQSLRGIPPHFYVFFFLAALRGLRDLSSPTRDWTWAPAVKAPSPNHWTARDFPPCLFFFKVLLRYNTHTIQFTHLKCIMQWVLVYSQGCTTITTVNFRAFHHSPKKHQTAQSSLHPTPAFSPAATNLLSVSIDLPILDISYTWNHKICGLCD